MDEIRRYNALVFIGREFVGVYLSDLSRMEKNIFRHVNVVLNYRFKSREDGQIYDTEHP